MDDNKPYFTEDGTLIIPFDCPDESYKFWQQGNKSLPDILKELKVDRETWARYTHEKYPEDEDSES